MVREGDEANRSDLEENEAGQQFVIRAIDERGDPITDYNIQLYTRTAPQGDIRIATAKEYASSWSFVAGANSQNHFEPLHLMRQRKRHTVRWIGITALLCAASACAPEPTTPAGTSLAGTWTANANLYTLSNFKMVMIQEPQGIVSGTWFAKGTGGGGGCPVATPCDAFGNLIGRNTIAQVEIELLGAGRFEGVLIEPDRLRGIFSVGEAYDTITFRKFSNAVSTRVTQ